MEIFYIYKEAATDNQPSDRHTVCSSNIFKLSSVGENNNTTPTPPHPLPVLSSHSFPTHSIPMFPLPVQFPILTLGLQKSVTRDVDSED